MNKPEMVAVFSAMQKLGKLKQYDELMEVIDEVLLEVRDKSVKKDEKNLKKD